MTELDASGGAPPPPAANDDPEPRLAPAPQPDAADAPAPESAAADETWLPPAPDEPLPPSEAAAPAPMPRAGLSIDFSSPIAFAALAIGYVASRAPFMNIGYGTDPDAWRVALSGYWLREQHEYYPSRLPGYPLPDLASAAVIKWGWLATNSLTLAVSLLGLWFFARIVRRLELPAAPLVVLGFAFTPLLWINSMNTMDYMWALTFILGCYFFLLRGQVPLAGIMLGLAAASRPTSIAFVVPFTVYVVRDGRRGELRDFIVWSIAPAMLAYLPIVWKYGPDFINFYDSKVGYLNVLRLLAKDCLGLIGSAAVLLAAALSLPKLVRLPADFVRDKHVTLWVLVIAVAAIIFVRLPHESAYLIPLYPFGFFVMGRYFYRPTLFVAVAAIIFAGFVDIGTHGADLNTQVFRHARLGEGLVLSNRSTMNAQLSFTRDLLKQPIPDHSVVMIGFSYPQFAVLNRDVLHVDILEKDSSSISQLSDKGKTVNNPHNVTYVWLLDYDAFNKFRKQKYNIFYTIDAGRSAAALYHYRPGLYDGIDGLQVKQLDLGRGPSGGGGGARTDR